MEFCGQSAVECGMTIRRASPERAVQVTLRRWLELVLPVGTIVFAVKNEHAPKHADPIARARFFSKRKAEGVLPGFPDLGALMPGPQTVLFEVKAPKTGVVSDVQDGLHTRLRTLGYPVVVANSIETARGGLQALGIPLREAAGQATATARVRVAKPRKRLLNDPLPL